MNNFLFILINLLFVISNPVFAKENLNLKIVYPQNNAKINADSTFFIGDTDPNAELTINKKKVKIYPNGGFVSVVNLRNGKNVFNIKVKNKSDRNQKQYILYAPEKSKVFSKIPQKIDAASIKPDKNLSLMSGDVTTVEFKGSRSNAASFKIGNSSEIPMIETIKGRKPTGIYRGSYRIKEEDNFKDSKITVQLSSDYKTISDTAQGCLTKLANESIPVVAEIVKNNAIVRTSPDKSRLTPLPVGVRLNITGIEGDVYRFRMGESMEGWITSDSVKILPHGTPVAESYLSSVNFEQTNSSVSIKIPLSQRLPFSIDQISNVMTLKIYGAVADINVLKQPPHDSFVNELKWIQPFKDIFALTIVLNTPQFSGYSYKYEDNSLILTIKKPYVNKMNFLKDKVITVDAGHGGNEYGSVGPTGVPEKDINLAISKFLKGELKNFGAKVVMTREEDKAVSLEERVKIADLNHSDILISIHNNALPDGRDPYKDHGSGTYYYQSQSLPLAKFIQKSMIESLKLRDNGIYWDSLALVRTNEEPAVLVEVGFMIHPEEYILLTNEDFQKKAAKAISDGIHDYYEQFIFTD